MLEGEKVRLRPLRREDTPVLWQYWSDLDVATRASNEPPKPLTLEETQDLYEELGKKENLVRFAIEAEGELVGSCTLHSIDKHNRHCEVGIALGKAHWAKGYGQDALRMLVDFAFRYHNMHRVGLEVLADDERAVACYRNVGFVEEGRIRSRDWFAGGYRDVMVMGILEDEWRSDDAHKDSNGRHEV